MYRFLKTLRLVCCFVLALSFLMTGSAENVLKITEGGIRDQMVRVCLTRLGGRNRLDFTFTAPYMLESDNQTVMYFRAGSQRCAIAGNHEKDRAAFRPKCKVRSLL